MHLPPLTRPRALVREHRVVVIGLVLIAAQLAYRAYAISGSWFAFDDLAFMSRAMNGPLSADYLMENYGGHLMPGGFFLTWYLTKWSPLDWAPWAAVLVALQALASLGMLRLLRSMFGARPFILVLLAAYLSYALTLPAFLWWAAGINQLPLQIALVFGLHAHLDHLRTGRSRSLVVCLLWTGFGLVFYEKTLVLFAVYAVIALAYFSAGPTPDRLRGLWERYRTGIIAHGALALGYLSVYTSSGLAFAPGNANQEPWAPIAYKLVMVALSPALVGGPLRWHDLSLGAIADPPQLLMVASWAALGGLVYYARQTRTRSVRGWFPILATLLGNVVLLAAGRAFFVGSDIALEFRYQTESAALFAICLGLVLLPLKGATEPNEVRPDTPLPYETPRYLGTVALIVCLLATVSGQRYVETWNTNNPAQGYFQSVETGLDTASEQPVPLIDLGLPLTLMWAYRTPENTYSHVLRMFADKTTYPDVRQDAIYLFDDAGHLRTAEVTHVRESLPGSRNDCGYPVGNRVTIPLDGPVIGGGWWIAMPYTSSRTRQVQIHVGPLTHDTTLESGKHVLYFKAEGDFSSVQITSGDPSGRSCVSHLTLGLPVPAGAAS